MKGACKLVGIKWDQARHPRERAIARGLARKQMTSVARIGVDGNTYRKGHRYLAIVNDVECGTVEFVAEGRAKASFKNFYESRTPGPPAGMKAVAMDVWESTIQASLEAVSLASYKIVFDNVQIT